MTDVFALSAVASTLPALGESRLGPRSMVDQLLTHAGRLAGHVTTQISTTGHVWQHQAWVPRASATSGADIRAQSPGYVVTEVTPGRFSVEAVPVGVTLATHYARIGLGPRPVLPPAQVSWLVLPPTKDEPVDRLPAPPLPDGWEAWAAARDGGCLRMAHTTVTTEHRRGGTSRCELDWQDTPAGLTWAPTPAGDVIEPCSPTQLWRWFTENTQEWISRVG